MNEYTKNQFHYLGIAYLESNACGTCDGSRKADTHRKLCVLFISHRLNISTEQADDIMFDGERLVSFVRESTTSLTDYLDTEIGFPIDTAPNYKRLTPAFVSKFLKLADDWFDDNTSLMSDSELNAVLERITKYTIGHVLTALESYGFEFVDGSHEKPDAFLIMKSKLGQVVTIKPNMYFGCKFNLDEKLAQ